MTGLTFDPRKPDHRIVQRRAATFYPQIDNLAATENQLCTSKVAFADSGAKFGGQSTEVSLCLLPLNYVDRHAQRIRLQRNNLQSFA